MFKIVAVYSPVLLKQGFTFENELFQRELDAQIVLLPHKTTPREVLYEHLADADALLTDYQQVDEDLLAHAPSLQCVSLLSTGYNVVDIPAAKKPAFPSATFGNTAPKRWQSILWRSCWL